MFANQMQPTMMVAAASHPPCEGQRDDGAVYLGTSFREDYLDVELLAVEEEDDDIASYNRWFEQQQRIRQERDQEGELEAAREKRQRIAEAILTGIHLTAPAVPLVNLNQERSQREQGKEEPIYSIIRSSDGTVLLKVPLEDPSRRDSTDGCEGERTADEITS